MLDLLLVAPPHQRDTRSLVHPLDVIGRRGARRPEPGDDLRDALYGHARIDGPTARPALLVPVRSYDPSALGVRVRRPGAEAVRAAATAFPEPGDELTSVIRETFW